MSYEIIRWNKGRSPGREELELTFKKRSLEFYAFSNGAGYHYAEHSHDYNKFLVMARGSMKWVIAGKEEILSPGDAVILPRNTGHEVTVLEDCECLEAHF